MSGYDKVHRAQCDSYHGNYFFNLDNGNQLDTLRPSLLSCLPMIKMPDGIVTVHLDDEHYRGAYYFRGDKLVVTAFGLKESSASMAVLQGEHGKAALNLAKLLLIDMVRAAEGECNAPSALSLQDATTQVCLQDSTIQLSLRCSTTQINL